LAHETETRVKTQVGVNLEFVRSSGKSFWEGIQTAARLGYKFASDLEPPVVTTDEGPQSEWMSETGAFQITGYTVRQDAFLRKRHKHDGVLSVACGTVDQAGRSLNHLGGLLAGG
jgi:hypothetical protein